MNTRKLAVSAALLAACGVANAAPKEGDSEFSFFGFITNTDSFSSANVNASYGYYFSDNFVATMGLSVSGTDTDGGNDEITTGGSVAARYNFVTTGSTPYLEAAYRVSDFDESSDTGFVDAKVGYNAYVGDNVGIFIEGGYGFSTSDGQADDGVFIGQFGIRVFL